MKREVFLQGNLLEVCLKSELCQVDIPVFTHLCPTFDKILAMRLIEREAGRGFIIHFSQKGDSEHIMLNHGGNLYDESGKILEKGSCEKIKCEAGYTAENLGVAQKREYLFLLHYSQFRERTGYYSQELDVKDLIDVLYRVFGKEKNILENAICLGFLAIEAKILDCEHFDFSAERIIEVLNATKNPFASWWEQMYLTIKKAKESMELTARQELQKQAQETETFCDKNQKKINMITVKSDNPEITRLALQKNEIVITQKKSGHTTISFASNQDEEDITDLVKIIRKEENSNNNSTWSQRGKFTFSSKNDCWYFHPATKNLINSTIYDKEMLATKLSPEKIAELAYIVFSNMFNVENEATCQKGKCSASATGCPFYKWGLTRCQKNRK